MIVEEYGCDMPILVTWVTLVFINIPPLLLELISGVYGCLSIRGFRNLSKLNETRCNLNPKRYIRLICFSTFDLIVGIPITVFYLYLDIKILVPFPGLAQEHSDFNQIYQYPAVLWRANTLTELSYELNRWITVWGAFVFFAIFGFTEESRNNYRTMLQTLVQVFVKITGIKSPSNSKKAEGCVFISFFFFLFLSLFSIWYTRNILFRIVFYNPSDSESQGITGTTS